MSLALEAARTTRGKGRYETLVRFSVFVCIFTGIFVAVEPSPYDITSIIAMTIWFCGGFKVHRATIPILVLLPLFALLGFAALMPYWSESDPRIYQLQSLYLVITGLFFTIYFSEHSIERAESMLKAYTLGAVVASVVGIFSYLDLFGLGFLLPYEGRAGGTFKDPNVFGSYLILTSNAMLQQLLLRGGRYSLVHVAVLAIVLIGIFLSFSRGSWGAEIASSGLVIASAFVTTPSQRLRNRMTLTVTLVLFVAVAAILVVLTIPEINHVIVDRVKLTQDYDEGVTGRFGNQLRSIPMLFDRFWGFGPLRYRLIFDLEPHNSFIGAFANDGWLGGFVWIFIVLTTGFVGFRLMFVPSPVRGMAQIVWPALFVYHLQGFQIDIDHWRHLFLCMGVVWGLEATRRRSSRPVPRHFPEAATIVARGNT